MVVRCLAEHGVPALLNTTQHNMENEGDRSGEPTLPITTQHNTTWRRWICSACPVGSAQCPPSGVPALPRWAVNRTKEATGKHGRSKRSACRTLHIGVNTPRHTKTQTVQHTAYCTLTREYSSTLNRTVCLFFFCKIG